MGNAASSLPYSIGKTPIVTNLHNEGWNLHDGQRKSDQTPVSVFVAKKPSLQKTLLGGGGANTSSHMNSTGNVNRQQLTQYACAMHHFMYAKKLRHPNILTVTATLDTDNPNDSSNTMSAAAATTNTHTGHPSPAPSSHPSSSSSSSSKDVGDLIIVTEPCIPFSVWLQQQDPKPTADQIVWGLQCVITAVSFLHTSANVSHGNLSMDSLYVTPAGDVKLWNFALVSSFATTQPPSVPRHFIEHEAILTPNAYRSPERMELRYDVIAASGVHVMDSYSMGILIAQLFQLPQYAPLPTPLVKAVQRLQTSNLKMRPKLAPLLKCPIFDTPYIQVQVAMTEFHVMPIEQKILFWNETVSSMIMPTTTTTRIPTNVILQKILPLIKNEIVTICDNEMLRTQEMYRKEVLVMLSPFFYISETILDRTTLTTQGIGKIIGILYKINDRAIRGTLLQKANYMADHFDKVTLNDAVFEPMCGGFSDSSAALRELTLKATASLVPHLSHPNLEKLSRYLVRLQSDPESSIRTNTVIFFSKLAPYLTEVTRQKILLPAFVRAMKDPFTPCRLAALRSTVKAKTFFDPMGIASRVMPAITPQLLDPSSEVRREAFMAVDDLLFVLRQESERLSTLPEQTLTNPNIPSATTAAVNGTAPPSNGVGVVAPVGRPPMATSTTAAVASAPSSGGFSLGGISSWMTSSSSTASSSNKPLTAVPNQPTTATPSAMPLQQQPVSTPQPPMYANPSAYAVPTPAMNQMNFNNTGTLNNDNNNDDNWDDVDDNIDDDDGGWGDDDDDLDVSGPKSTSVQPQKLSQSNIGRLAPSVAPPANTSSSLFTATSTNTKSNMDEEDDFFGGFDNKPAKPIIRPMTAGTGKLVVPVKKTLGGKLSTTPKPVIKKLTTSNNSSNAKDDEGSDNWDDF